MVEPATISKGILKLSENDFQQKADFFEANKSTLKLKKFVPASGAASRMFKFLSAFLNDFDIGNESINAYINRKKIVNFLFLLLVWKNFLFLRKWTKN